MDFSVLGPLQIRVRGATVPVRRGLPRLLLTYLVLHPGEPVRASVLADRMWNGRPPADAADAVHRVVSYVRHTLAAAGEAPLHTTPVGYLLDVSPAAVDSTRFAQLVRSCGGDPAESLRSLDEALSLWRGGPLADAAGLPWAAPLITELEELHLRAQELRVTTLLELGRHVDAVPQAQALVGTCPLRGSLRSSLTSLFPHPAPDQEAAMLLERVRLTTPTSPQRRHAGGHRLVTRPLAVTSAVLTGLMGGGMVVIQVVLLPFWRGAAPAEFRGWFTAHVGRIRGLMVPLGAGTGLVCAASAVAQRVGGGRSNPASVVAAAATAGVIAITVTVNEPMNHRFAGETLTDTETTELLRRWARWHHVRVVLGVTATVAAAAALTRQDA